MKEKGKILIVEDSLVTAAYLKHFFTKEGYEDILITDLGLDGISLFSRNLETIDLVILDIELPDFDGIGVASELRKIEVSRGIGEMFVPIIISSASFTESRKEICLKIGVQGLFDKPLTDKHKGAIRNLIEAKRLLCNREPRVVA